MDNNNNTLDVNIQPGTIHPGALQKDNRPINMRLRNDYVLSYPVAAPVDLQAVSYMSQMVPVLSEAENLEIKLSELNDALVNKKHYGKHLLWAFILAAMAIFGMYLIVSAASDPSAPNHAPFGAIATLVGFIGSIVALCRHGSDKTTYKDAVRMFPPLSGRLDQLYSGVDWSPFAMLPPDYRFSFSADFICRAILNGRATTMQQAVNLFEQDRNNKMMLAKQNEILGKLDSIQSDIAWL